MANIIPSGDIKGSVSYNFNASKNVDFEAIIYDRDDSELSEGAKALATELYDDISRTIKYYNLKYARASLNFLIMLREASPLQKRRERRDDSSAYIHEIAQATYLLWLYENTDIITSWLQKRANDDKRLNPELTAQKNTQTQRIHNRLIMSTQELDVSMAIAFLHDCMEDLGLKPARLTRFLNAIPNGDRKSVEQIVQGVVNLTKKPNDQPRAWMNRARKTNVSLLGKLEDRQHNLATIVGSDRSEPKIRAYIADTKIFLSRAGNQIRANGTLTYLAQYLYDQCDLLEVYFDVRNHKEPVEVLENKIEKALKNYTVRSVHPKIHPMLCMGSRILKDPKISHMLQTQVPNLEQVQWDLPLFDRVRPKRAS